MIFHNKQLFFKNKFILLVGSVSILLNALLWVFVFLKVSPTSEWIPLHYNIYFGVDLFGPWYKIFSIPLLGLSVIMINHFLAYFLLDKEKVLSYSIILGTCMIQLFLWIPSIFLTSFITV